MSWTHHHHRHDQPASALYLVTAPSAVVSTADMKKHLRVEAENTDDDELIAAMTAAVTQHIDGRDGWLGRALGEQTWDMKLSWFPWCGFIDIPLPPLIEVVSVKYVDEDEDEQTLDASKYHVVGEGHRGRVQLVGGECWPVLACGWPEPVTVRFRAGYVDGSNSPATPNVPAPIIAAIKLLTANLYENREHVVIGQTAIELPWSAQALLSSYRILSH